MLYVLGSNSHYLKGKRDRIAGRPILPMPARCKHSQSACDERSGWIVADNNIANHPDWTPEKILA